MAERHPDITEVLEDFVQNYHDLRNLRNDITKALYGRLYIISDTDAQEASLKVVNDADFIKALASAIDVKDPLSALRIFALLIGDLNAMVESKEATLHKLKERVALQGAGSPEVAVAFKKQSQYMDDIYTLKRRIELVMKKFYLLRKSIVAKVAEYSLGIAGSFGNQYNEMATDMIRKYHMPVEKLVNIDSTLTTKG